MKAWTVSITQTVLADSENEAWSEFAQNIRHGQYDSEQIEITREPESDDEVTPAESLLNALFEGLTEEESKYLERLLANVTGERITLQRARELFKKRYPDSKWLPENRKGG